MFRLFDMYILEMTTKVDQNYINYITERNVLSDISKLYN